jgi:hypothetical protein
MRILRNDPEQRSIAGSSITRPSRIKAMRMVVPEPVSEDVMATAFSSNQPVNRLRFVFDDAIIAVRLPPHATFGDVASLMDRLSTFHDGVPLAIDVTRDRNAIPRSPIHAT